MAISQIPEIETPIKTLASDNAAGASARILEALAACNAGHQLPYGGDDYSRAAQTMFENLFGRRLGMFFAFNGTGANILALSGMLNRCESVICAQTAHLVDDETGAPEAILGAKIVALPTPDGKLTPEQIAPCLAAKGNFHHAQPRVVAIAQLTETGTLYTPEEVCALADFCHENGLYLFMDGARLSNAVASLEVPVKSVTADAGVDVLVFGGTKNGCAFGEAVLVFNPELEAHYPVLRKGAGQLASKMRYIAAQFLCYVGEGIYLENARRANAAAQRLAQGLEKLPGVSLCYPVQGNEIFLTMPESWIEPLQSFMYFNVMAGGVCRLVTAFDITDEDVDDFLDWAGAQLQGE